jgi:hypothetical protein
MAPPWLGLPHLGIRDNSPQGIPAKYPEASLGAALSHPPSTLSGEWWPFCDGLKTGRNSPLNG